MSRPAAFLLLLGGAYFLLDKYAPRAVDFNYSPILETGSAETVISNGEINIVTTRADNSGWLYPARASIYIDAINKSEKKYGIPHKLLGRLLYQESRFKPATIYGGKANHRGAIGIAQIVPKWHPSANPSDPWSSIDYAGLYLSQLYRQFGTWQYALMAYNWGPGNLRKYLDKKATGQLAFLPLETRNYYSQILGDVMV